MSRGNKSFWDADSEDKLSKAVNNYNAKIRRLKKKYEKVENPEERKKLLASLPPTAKKSVLKTQIMTKRDLNEEVASLKRFSDKGAEELVKVPIAKNTMYITKYQLKEMKRLEAKTERHMAKRRERYQTTEATSGGKGLGYPATVGMSKAEELSLRHLDAFTRSQDLPSVMRRFKTLQMMGKHSFWKEKDIRYRENYIKSLDQLLNVKPGIQNIINKIRSLELDDFLEIVSSEQGLMEFGYFPFDNVESSYQHLKDVWINNPKLDELEKARAEAKEKARAEAKAKREEAKRQQEQARIEAEIQARIEAEAKAKAEAEERARRKVQAIQREHKRKSKHNSYKNIRKKKQKASRKARKRNRRR